jgi:hypothetical protein
MVAELHCKLDRVPYACRRKQDWLKLSVGSIGGCPVVAGLRGMSEEKY